MIIKSSNIYTPKGIIDGYLKLENGKIKEILTTLNDEAVDKDYGNFSILPGFIDLHIHGYGTGSFTHENSETSLNRMSKSLVTQGVTSYLPTTGADAIERITKMSNQVHQAITCWDATQGAEILGIHYEGPFINKVYKGMQKEEYCINPSQEVFHEMMGELPMEFVKLMTLAPELEGSISFLQYLKENKVQVSVGHSAATFEDIKKALPYGIGGVTHMFSGMKGFHHRELGVVGSAWYFDELYCEFAKQSGKTVLPEAVALTLKLKGLDKITLCSDCVGLAHVTEPFYHYVRQTTFIPDGEHIILKHDNGTQKRLSKFDIRDMEEIEIGYLTSVKNLMKNNNLSLMDIMTIASINTAKYINVYDRKGSLEIDKDADIIVLDENINLVDVYVSGVRQEL